MENDKREYKNKVTKISNFIDILYIEAVKKTGTIGLNIIKKQSDGDIVLKNINIVLTVGDNVQLVGMSKGTAISILNKNDLKYEIIEEDDKMIR